MTTPRSEELGLLVSCGSGYPLSIPEGSVQAQHQNDLRGSYVPVQHAPTRAGVDALREFFLLDPAALGAYLARTVWPYRHYSSPGALSLGGEDSYKRGPPRIQHALGEGGAGQAGRVQVFVDDGSILVHQMPGQFVGEVLPLVGDLAVLPGQAGLSFLRRWEPRHFLDRARWVHFSRASAWR